MGTPTDDYAAAREARDAATRKLAELLRAAGDDTKNAPAAWAALADYFDGITKQLDARAAEAVQVKADPASADPVAADSPTEVKA